jgi:hypothetical protein
MIYIITIFVFNIGCGCHQQWEVWVALFSDDVDELNNKIGQSTNGLPAIVVQFAKLKKFRGKILFYLN